MASGDGDDDGDGDGRLDELIIVEKSKNRQPVALPDPFCSCRRETRTTLRG